MWGVVPPAGIGGKAVGTAKWTGSDKICFVISPGKSAYVDDRACFTGDYAATLDRISQFKPYWEAD